MVRDHNGRAEYTLRRDHRDEPIPPDTANTQNSEGKSYDLGFFYFILQLFNRKFYPVNLLGNHGVKSCAVCFIA